MGKQIHILISKDTVSYTGVCKNCGPVELRNKMGVFRCINSVRQHRGKGGPAKQPHGLTVEQARLFRKGKVCEICGSTSNLAVDHCHEQNVIRGVLCGNCNRGLGSFKDDAVLLENAINYLSTTKQTGR